MAQNDAQRHRTTDPACHFHIPPVTRLQRYLFNRARGRVCPLCVPAPRPPLGPGPVEIRLTIELKPDAHEIHEALLRWKRERGG